MVIDESKKTQIVETFKAVRAFKDEAKDLTGSATDAMKRLIESFSVDKEEQKIIKKAMSKAYKEWSEEQDGEEDSLEDTLTILEALRREE